MMKRRLWKRPDSSSAVTFNGAASVSCRGCLGNRPYSMQSPSPLLYPVPNSTESREDDSAHPPRPSLPVTKSWGRTLGENKSWGSFAGENVVSELPPPRTPAPLPNNGPGGAWERLARRVAQSTPHEEHGQLGRLSQGIGQRSARPNTGARRDNAFWRSAKDRVAALDAAPPLQSTAGNNAWADFEASVRDTGGKPSAKSTRGKTAWAGFESSVRNVGGKPSANPRAAPGQSWSAIISRDRESGSRENAGFGSTSPGRQRQRASVWDNYRSRSSDRKAASNTQSRDADRGSWFEDAKPATAARRSAAPPTEQEFSYGVTSARKRNADRDRDRRDPPARTKGKAKPRRRNDDAEEDQYADREDTWEKVEERRMWKEKKLRRKEELVAKQNLPTPIHLPELISISNLGLALGVKPALFLTQLIEFGFEDLNQESIMTGETAALVAQEYGFDPTVEAGDSVDLKPRPPPADPTLLPPRPPIVTIMGHVDHGKTTMLDWLRKSAITAGEHGGITQHIGAFSVKLSTGKEITFLDTPGHAAFLTMRQRGANVTDIVVLVVAADDSVKPQTLEALKHARASKVPIIVAINKIDKEEARIDQVKADIARYGLEIEDYGGDVQVVGVSGKTGQGMDDLEENILTLSEILDMRAERDGMAEGWVLESSIKLIGRVATVLVKRGTLRLGDIILAGSSWAKIRMLRDAGGLEVDEAPPGTPVEILGWRELPSAGDLVLQAPDEGKAKNAAAYRKEMGDREKTIAEHVAQEKQKREKAAKAEAEAEAIAADTTSAREAAPEESGPKTATFVVKADVVGSVEAVCACILEIGNNEVSAHILQSGPGQVNESDVEHAAATGSSIINFNSPISSTVSGMAESAGVAILDHNIIYHVVDDVRAKLSALLPPRLITRVLGEADILQVFAINLKGRLYKNMAGCRVRNGQLARASKYRILRKGDTVFDGKLESMKYGKKDMTEIKKGSECGLGFDGWQDFEEGDQVQAYEVLEEARYL